MTTLLLDATTDGPYWTMGIAAAVCLAGARFVRQGRREARRERERASRRREMARKAEIWLP